MRKIAFITVIILLQISLCFGTASSAVKQKPSKQKQSSTVTETTAKSEIKPSPEYLSVPFDMSVEKIPVPFLGHNALEVKVAFYHREPPAKDEFETTEQYQKRLSDRSDMPLFGSVSPDSILAFVIDDKEDRIGSRLKKKI